MKRPRRASTDVTPPRLIDTDPVLGRALGTLRSVDPPNGARMRVWSRLSERLGERRSLLTLRVPAGVLALAIIGVIAQQQSRSTGPIVAVRPCATIAGKIGGVE